MSHRERCMTGAFSKILIHLGILKDPSSSSPPSSSSSSSLSCHHDQPAEEARSRNLPPSAQSTRESSFDTRKRNIPRGSLHPDKAPFATTMHAKETTNCGKLPVLNGFRVRVSSSEPSSALKGISTNPVVCECTPGSGGVQGLQWYSEKLMMDEDGDVAQEFLDEVVSHAPGSLPRACRNFKLIVKTIPAKLKGPVCTSDGNVVQCIESTMGSTYIHLGS